MKTNMNLLQEWVVRGENPMEIAFPIPENAKGEQPLGFVYQNDSAFNAFDWQWITLDVEAVDQVVDITVQARFYNDKVVTAQAQAWGAGVHTINLTMSDFDIETYNKNIWENLSAFIISGTGTVKGCHLRKRESLYVSSAVCGKSAKPGESVTYEVCVSNTTEQPIHVAVKQLFEGWESMIAVVEPQQFSLEIGESKVVRVQLSVHDRMVPGGHEETTLRFIANGDSAKAETITFSTMRTLPHPYIMKDKKGWAEVAEKIRNYEQYQPAFDAYVKAYEEWVVTPPEKGRPYCYDTYHEHYIMSSAYAYAITGEIKYAEKVAEFLRQLCNETDGYPVRLRGCSQSYVQEGHFFQHMAIPYDIIYDAGVLSEEDHRLIEKTFRIYMNTLDVHLKDGHISNWLLSEITGGLFCALSLQDMHMAKRFLFGEGGSIDELRKGLFNDGWWHECSVGYNIWVSSMFLHTAHAMMPFGYDLVNARFQIPYNDEVSSCYANQGRAVSSAMVNKKWGGNLKNYVCIKDMFDATLPFMDYRGVVFGIADSDEKKIGGVHFGSTYDLAYTYYQDPEYIRAIKLADEYDPVFGHPELPDVESKYVKNNAYADNIGVSMLRSQTEGREQREQIQAVLRYGSHGGAHGHFETTELLSVMRYGKSIYNPEMVWWGYYHMMYKFYVQTSVTKNMVIVDRKMQVPADSRRKLFYSGEAIQATCVEVNAQWAYPPYGGMVYLDGKETLEGRMRLNASSLNPAQNPPVYGELSEYTEPIQQVRAMAVLDDCIVLFDYLKGDDGKQHRYDRLFHVKGLNELIGEDVQYIGQTPQYDENPISDGQFVTDCHWYQANGSTVARFSTIYGEGEDMRGTRSNYNQPGILNYDIYTSWPRQTEQMIGMTAESVGNAVQYQTYTIPLYYHVDVDGKMAVEGEFGAWLLGVGNCDIDVSGVKKLSLHVKNNQYYNEQRDKVTSPKCLFWGDAYVVMADGSTKSVTELNPEYINVDAGYGVGKDYENGRVLIQGVEYPEAIPTHPLNQEEEAVIRVDLTGLDAVRFVGHLGVDNFPGEEEQRRKTYAVRSDGETGRFVSVVEPYEGDAKVVSVSSENADSVSITLADGRVQVVSIQGIETGDVRMEFAEYRDGRLLREESVVNQA
ncbi:MAG: hypothetical protein ACI4CT_05675 [Lachnospiraceae bacterium]